MKAAVLKRPKNLALMDLPRPRCPPGGALVAGIGGFFLAPAVIGAISGIYQVRREETASSEALE